MLGKERTQWFIIVYRKCGVHIFGYREVIMTFPIRKKGQQNKITKLRFPHYLLQTEDKKHRVKPKPRSMADFPLWFLPLKLPIYTGMIRRDLKSLRAWRSPLLQMLSALFPRLPAGNHPSLVTSIKPLPQDKCGPLECNRKGPHSGAIPLFSLSHGLLLWLMTLGRVTHNPPPSGWTSSGHQRGQMTGRNHRAEWLAGVRPSV